MADKRGSIKFQDVERPKVASHDSTVLDLAFALDCTSSMGTYIRQAQENIRHIVEQIVAREKSDIHLALIEYRDHPPQDYSFVTRVHNFTALVKEMKSWLESASAHGGGDGPEAVADAWHALLKLNWRENATKICVHIADAPPHGLMGGKRDSTDPRFNFTGVTDGFPKGCPDGIDPVVVMNQLAEKGVTLYMVGCEPSINASRPFYMAMAHLTGGQYVPLTSATLLAKVIIGGAEEELSLEKLMAEVEEEVRQEREQNGGALDEEELSRRIHTRFNSRGVRSKQLCRNNTAMTAAPEYAQAMSKMTNLADISAAMQSVPAEASSGGSSPERRGSGVKIMNRRRSSGSRSGRLRFTSPSKKSAEIGAPEPASPVPPLDDYNVEEEELNMFQAQRMVQKAINRTKNK